MPKRAESILYVEEGWTIEKIKEVLEKRNSIEEYAIILHDKDVDTEGKLKKAHYHIYMSFGKTNWQFDGIAKWFDVGPERIERIKAPDISSVINYYLHRSDPDKHQYNVKDIIANFDVENRLNNYRGKTALDILLERCGSGEITRYNYTEYIDAVTYARNEKKILSAFTYYERLCASRNEGRRNCRIIWMYGPSGMGKTTLSVLYARQLSLSVYITATGRDPFSHYAQESVVIIDDLRTETFPFEDLLKLLDPNYLAPVNSRYHNKVLSCDYIIVTTVLSPQEFVRELFLKESAIQLYRRLHEIWHVRSNSVEMYDYDMNTEEFRLFSIEDNPVAEIVKQEDSKRHDYADSVQIMKDIASGHAKI